MATAAVVVVSMACAPAAARLPGPHDAAARGPTLLVLQSLAIQVAQRLAHQGTGGHSGRQDSAPLYGGRNRCPLGLPRRRGGQATLS